MLCFLGIDGFDFFVVDDPFSCERIGVEGEHAGVADFIRKGSGDESHDVFVLEADICSIVKKDVKKEEDINYVPKEVITDYNLQLPSTVTLRDAKDRKWKTIVKVWADGRTWLSRGWRGLCRRNLIEEED
nr:B3 domain-containing protein At5g60130-like isoform X2 [Ipomoea trifida]